MNITELHFDLLSAGTTMLPGLYAGSWDTKAEWHILTLILDRGMVPSGWTMLNVKVMSPIY